MVERTFRISATLRRLIFNTGWLLVLRVLRLLFALFVGIWVARYLGPQGFGRLSFAVAFVTLFGPIAHLGLDAVVVREIVNEPDRKREILGTAFFLRLASATVCFAASLVVIGFMRPGDALSRNLVGIIAFGNIFGAFDTIDLWFQSQVEVKYSVYAKSVGLVCASIGKILLILAGATIVSFAGMFALEAVIGAAGLLIVYRYRGHLVRAWRFSFARTRSLLAISWPMILSGTLFMIYLRIDQVMLREMVDEGAVGVYSTAVRISEVWYFIPVIVTTSVFPELVKSKRLGESVYRARLQSLYDFLAWTSAPIVAGLIIFARPLVVFLYGEAFSGGGAILAILTWPCPFIFMREAYGRWLLNENLTKYFMLAHGSGAVVNVTLNLLLIPLWGGVGAAIATVVSYTVGGYLICFVHPRTRIAGVMMTRALAMPVLRLLRLRGRAQSGD